MKKPTVLIVDDTPSSLFKTKTHIEEWGYIALTAPGGQEALDILGTTPVDLIISDQVMPGMDGIALLLAVRELYEDIPFIMLTAHGSIDKAVISIRQGADSPACGLFYRTISQRTRKSDSRYFSGSNGNPFGIRLARQCA